MASTTEAAERLRRVQLVTEATLARLSLEELTDELLVRVRELLGVDTAAILLLEPDGRSLIATAAKGLEEEVERGVRIPVGGGFAGKVAATARPVILPEVDHRVVLNPILLDKGIRTLLGVPLIANGEVVGVLHVGSLTPRVFKEEDVELLQLVADRVALSIRARTQQRQRQLAETLQRSLLPEAIPSLADIEIAVRYLPAEGGVVGGDWYDVFELPSSQLCVCVGDVVGRGLPAAIAMARLRNGVRALAFVDRDPARIVSHANDLILHFEENIIATMLFAVIEGDGTVTYASAGHMPPLVIDPSGVASLLEEDSEPALGVVPYAEYRRRTAKLEPGTFLVLYTDGLVERRHEPLDKGLDDLRKAASERRWASPEELCRRLAGPEIVEERTEDDLAIVAMRYRAQDHEDLSLTLNASARELARLRRSLRVWLQVADVPEQDAQDVLVAVSEAVANSIEHAYPPGGGSVSVRMTRGAGALEVVVSDLGRWRPARGKHRGRGRDLMQRLMDDVEIETGEHGTRVTMHKKITWEGHA